MKKLKDNKLIDFDKVDFDNVKPIKIKAKFVFDPKDINDVRKSSERDSRASTILALNNKECEVVINDYELGYELDEFEEYEIIFKRKGKDPYKVVVFGNVIKLI